MQKPGLRSHVRELMKAKDLTIVDVQRITGLDWHTVARYAEPCLDTKWARSLVLIANALGVKPQDLVSGDEENSQDSVDAGN